MPEVRLQAPLLSDSVWPRRVLVLEPVGGGVDEDLGVGLAGGAEEAGLGDVGDGVGVRVARVARRVELAGEGDRHVGHVGRIGQVDRRAAEVGHVDRDRIGPVLRPRDARAGLADGDRVGVGVGAGDLEDGGSRRK